MSGCVHAKKTENGLAWKRLAIYGYMEEIMAFNRLAACRNNIDASIMIRSKLGPLLDKLENLEKTVKHGSTDAKLAAKIKRVGLKIWRLYCKARRLDASTKHMRRTLREVKLAAQSRAFGNCDHKEGVEMRIDFCKRHDPGLCAKLVSGVDIIPDE